MKKHGGKIFLLVFSSCPFALLRALASNWNELHDDRRFKLPLSQRLRVSTVNLH